MEGAGKIYVADPGATLIVLNPKPPVLPMRTCDWTFFLYGGHTTGKIGKRKTLLFLK